MSYIIYNFVDIMRNETSLLNSYGLLCLISLVHMMWNKQTTNKQI